AGPSTRSRSRHESSPRRQDAKVGDPWRLGVLAANPLVSSLRDALKDVIRVLDRAPGLVHVFSPRVAKVLVDGEQLEPRDAVDALDELGFTLRRWIHRADLTAALDAARKVLLPAVEKIQFFAFEPQIGPLPRRAADVLRAYTRVVPWPAPEGTLVA